MMIQTQYIVGHNWSINTLLQVIMVPNMMMGELGSVLKVNVTIQSNGQDINLLNDSIPIKSLFNAAKIILN